MGRVLIGAMIVAVLGGVIGAASSYGSIEIRQFPGPRLEVNEPLRALSIMIGAGAGAIVGAIAGAVSAQPGARPVPRWMWVSLLAVMLVSLVLGVVCLLVPGRHNPPPQPPPTPDTSSEKPSLRESQPDPQLQSPPMPQQPKQPGP